MFCLSGYRFRSWIVLVNHCFLTRPNPRQSFRATFKDDDGDGVCEVHVNTMEGFWSLLRSWLRPHRGISQEKLPVYLGFFEFVHNVRKRGKALGVSHLLHTR